MRTAVLLLLAAAVALSAADKIKPQDDPNQIGNRKVDRGWNLYSIEKEIVLGKKLAEDVMRQARIVDDPLIAEYVNRIGQNLARNSDTQLPLIVHVIEDDSINALTLPGGYLFVNTGVLENSANEAQLAAVLAHEIAHVAARHGTRQDTKGQMASYMTIPLIFVGGWGGVAARQATQFAIPATMYKFSRAFEEEADNLGLQYMYKTGYDPVAYLEFFERIQALQRKQPGAVRQIFESHPPTGKRIEHSQERIARNLEPRPEYTVNTSEFDQVKAHWLELLRRDRLADLDRTADPEQPAEPAPPTLKRRLDGIIADSHSAALLFH